MNTPNDQTGGCAAAPCSPLALSAGELLEIAINRKPYPMDRVLATFADPSNWVQLYDGKASPASDYQAKACEWAFVGPSRPPYELAQHALKPADKSRASLYLGVLGALREFDAARQAAELCCPISSPTEDAFLLIQRLRQLLEENSREHPPEGGITPPATPSDPVIARLG